MKAKILIIACLVATTNLFAEIDLTQANYGAKLGVNFANVTNSESGIRTGLVLGGFATYPLNDELFFQPELLFSMQGTKVNDFGAADYYGLDLEYKWAMNYLNLPLLIKYMFSEKIYATAGPQIGLLVSSKIKIGSESESLKDELKTLDLGLNFGLGFQHESGICADIRYIFGLSDTFKNSDGDKYANRVLQITVGYTLSKN